MTAEVLSLPQPISEWSRLREAALRRALGTFWSQKLEQAALNTEVPLAKRLRAVRLLSPLFTQLSKEFVDRLARAELPELRGQGAWFLGIRRNEEAVPLLTKLLEDEDAFVRRRAAEALGRLDSPGASSNLVARLGDSDRIVRYTAMTGLASFNYYTLMHMHESIVAIGRRSRPATFWDVWGLKGCKQKPRATKSMNHFSVRRPWAAWSLLMLFACVAVGIFFALQPAAPTASVVILPPETQVQKQSSRFSRIAKEVSRNNLIHL